MRFLPWGFTLSEVGTVPCHFAKVAFPLASRALLLADVAEALAMEGAGAVIAADKLTALLADAAAVDVALLVALVLVLDELAGRHVVLHSSVGILCLVLVGFLLENLVEGQTVPWG